MLHRPGLEEVVAASHVGKSTWTGLMLPQRVGAQVLVWTRHPLRKRGEVKRLVGVKALLLLLLLDEETLPENGALLMARPWIHG